MYLTPVLVSKDCGIGSFWYS